MAFCRSCGREVQPEWRACTGCGTPVPPQPTGSPSAEPSQVVAPDRGPTLEQWEYRVVRVTITERWGSKRQAEEVEVFQTNLNELGRDGWEMVGFESVPLLGGITGNVKDQLYLAFFKRKGALI